MKYLIRVLKGQKIIYQEIKEFADESQARQYARESRTWLTSNGKYEITAIQ